MRLLAPPIEEIINAEKDIFDRDRFAEGLLRLFSRTDESLVVVLDEQWGSGKTVFSKRLENRATKQGFPAIYFDAFERDYEPDVFISLVSAVMAKLPSKEKKERFQARALSVAKVLGKVGLKSSLRLVTMGLLDVAELEKTSEEIASEVRGVIEGEIDDLIEERLDRAQKDQIAFKEFKAALSLVRQNFVGADGNKPLIFIIDELDRCKPSYALALLETIKHFFAVPNVKFLLVCQVDQILSSIKHAYGAEVDAQRYLEKFVHTHVYFPVPDAHAWRSQISAYVSGVVFDMPSDGENGTLLGDMANFITNLAVRKNCSFRNIERVLTQFAICMDFTKKQQLRLGAVVFVLCDLKHNNPKLFQKAKRGSLSYRELEQFYDFLAVEDDWYIRWLQYFFDTQTNLNDPKWKDLNSYLAGYSVRNPKQTALYFANNVVDCISV